MSLTIPNRQQRADSESPRQPDVRLPITAVVAVRNEIANIRRCLENLAPVQRVIVVDSNSTDGTAGVAESMGAEVVQFQYAGGYPKKRQWALDHLPIATEWILLVDSDETIPSALWEEIRESIQDRADVNAFLITKGFHFLGRRLRFGGFSHSAVLLFRTGNARFEELLDDDASGQDMEVHERVLVHGTIAKLRRPLIHQDFKGLEAYIARHNKYSTWEAQLRDQFLASGRYGTQSVRARLFGSAQERRRFLKKLAIRAPFEPLLWFLYHYVLRLGFLEGRRGLIAAQIRSAYIAQVRAKMYELRLAREGQKPAGPRPVATGTTPAPKSREFTRRGE